MGAIIGRNYGAIPRNSSERFCFPLQVCCHGGTAREQWNAFVHKIAKWSVFGTALRLLMLWAPLIFYWKIFRPCWECFDFEGAATHEVGHVLGLGHPDKAALERTACNGGSTTECLPGQNVYNPALIGGPPGGRIDNSTCRNPWANVTEGVPPGAEVNEATGVRPSIMEAFTQFNPRVCITEDDLEALNTLYPDCSHALTGSPVCFKSDHNIGWVRLAVWLGVPMILCLLLLILCHSFVNRHQLKRLKSAHNLVGERNRDLNSARGHIERQADAVEELSRALTIQKKKEKETIQREARRLSMKYVESHLARARANKAAAPGAAEGGINLATIEGAPAPPPRPPPPPVHPPGPPLSSPQPAPPSLGLHPSGYRPSWVGPRSIPTPPPARPPARRRRATRPAPQRRRASTRPRRKGRSRRAGSRAAAAAPATTARSLRGRVVSRSTSRTRSRCSRGGRRSTPTASRRRRRRSRRATSRASRRRRAS